MVTHLLVGAAICRVSGVTIETPSFLSEDDLAHELAMARLRTAGLLDSIREFAVLAHAEPWVYLDDLLRDLRASAVTVATLEQLQGARF